MTRVDMLTLCVYTIYHRLKIQDDGGEQIYQLCDSWDKDIIWQNFTHYLKMMVVSYQLWPLG